MTVRGYPPGRLSSLNSIIDITMPGYGAQGDGVTDDTEAIRRAINDVSAAGGGAVYVPAVDVAAGKYYRVTDRIIHRSNVFIFGDGYGSYIKNDREDTVSGIDRSVFAWGAYQGSEDSTNNVEDETFYSCAAITRGSKMIRLVTAAEAANFAAGDIVFIRNNVRGDTPDAGQRQVHWQHTAINKVEWVDAATGWVKLKYSHYRSDTSAGTISMGVNSGNYNASNGFVTIAVTGSGHNLLMNELVTLSLSGAGAVSALNGSALTRSGTTGTTMIFQGEAGLTAATTITGGSVTFGKPGGSVPISQGTFNTTTGIVTLTTTVAHGLSVSAGIHLLSLTGTGDVAKLSRIARIAISATSGSVLTYSAAANDPKASTGTLPGASTITGGTIRYGMMMAKSSGTILDEYDDPVQIRENVGLYNLHIGNYHGSGKGIFLFGGALNFRFERLWLDGSDMFPWNCMHHGTINDIEGVVSSKLFDLAVYCGHIRGDNISRYQTGESFKNPNGLPDVKCIIGQMCHDIELSRVRLEGGVDDITGVYVSRCTDVVLRDWKVIMLGATEGDHHNPVVLTDGPDFGPDGVTIENMEIYGTTPVTLLRVDNPNCAPPKNPNRLSGIKGMGNNNFIIDITEGSKSVVVENTLAPDMLIRNRSTDSSVILRNNVVKTQNYAKRQSLATELTTKAADTTAMTYNIVQDGAGRTGGWRIRASGVATTDAGAATRYVRLMFDTTEMVNLPLEASMTDKAWEINATVIMQDATNIETWIGKGSIGSGTGTDSTSVTTSNQGSVSISAPDREFSLAYFLDNADTRIILRTWEVEPFGHDVQRIA